MKLRVKKGFVVHAGPIRFSEGEIIPENKLTSSSVRALLESGQVEAVPGMIDLVIEEMKDLDE